MNQILTMFLLTLAMAPLAVASQDPAGSHELSSVEIGESGRSSHHEAAAPGHEMSAGAQIGVSSESKGKCVEREISYIFFCRTKQTAFDCYYNKGDLCVWIRE